MDTARKEPSRRNLSISLRPTTINNLKLTDALLTVETLYEKDDIGVEEFIKSVRFARGRVSDQDSLLNMIIAQKISGHAKRSIRFCHICCYEELYEALRSQVSIPISKASSRTKLQSIRQGITETVQSPISRFKYTVSELEYAIQDEHSNPTTRNIILEQENKEAVKFYIHNLERK